MPTHPEGKEVAPESDGSRLISQSEAARRLDTSRPTVVFRVAIKELTGEMVGDELKIVAASVDAYLAKREAGRQSAAA